ncbi:MAG: cysteine desulfurase family protein [Phycisphaerales bacterium]
MASPIHLDHNATTRPGPEVVAAMRAALETCWGNPSSVHRAGIEARQRVELARASVAGLLGCRDREIVFTSGGTESANLAIRGTLEHFAESPRRVLATSRLEHSAVRECAERMAARGIEVCWLPHRSDGVVEVDALRELLAARSSEIALVSLMWANNETGVIAPVAEIGSLCREHGVRFHCDAVQWAGRLPLDFSTLPIDLLTFSGHKFHGPKGVGGLLVRGGVRLAPQIVGGPQERERRGGTENVPGIVGLGAAAEAARASIADGRWERIAGLRDRFEREVLARCEGAVVNASAAPRLPNTSNIGFPRLEAEAILVVLSERGVHASAGAACSSGSLDPSPVLLAMGVPREIAHGSVRFSLGPETTAEELDRSVDEIAGAVDRLSRSMI